MRAGFRIGWPSLPDDTMPGRVPRRADCWAGWWVPASPCYSPRSRSATAATPRWMAPPWQPNWPPCSLCRQAAGDRVGDPSAAEDGQVGFSDAAGVVDKVDRNDLRAGDREPYECDRPPVRGRDDAGGSVDQCRQGDLGGSQAGERASGHRRRTADRLGTVRAHYDLWVEGLQQRLEVAVAGGGEEGLDDCPLPGQVGAEDWSHAMDPPASATGQLAGRGRRAPDDRRDVVERDGENVVQDECKPFCG